VLATALCSLSAIAAFFLLPESLPISKRRVSSLGIQDIIDDMSEVNFGMLALWVARFGLSWAIYGMVAIYPFFVSKFFGNKNIEFKLGLFMFVGACSQMITLLLFFPSLSKFLGKHFTLMVAASAGCVLLCFLRLYTDITDGDYKVYLHLVWKTFLHAAIAVSDAALPDTMALYVGERYIGFAQGFLGIFKSLAAIFGSLVCGILYAEDESGALHSFLTMGIACGLAAAAAVAAKMIAKEERDLIGRIKKQDEDSISESTRL
jgi:hypothetical protein